MKWLLIFLTTMSASAVNLMPNSSFECGFNRGWLNFGSGGANAFQGNLYEFKSGLTNDAFHGRYSWIAKGVTYTRAIWLTNGTWTFTFYAKASAAAGPFRFGLLDGDNLSATTPPTNATITTSWVRYTNTFTAASNAFYWGKFDTLQPQTFQVDAFQLEPGSAASAYAPQSTVECGITIANTNKMWFSGDTPSFTLNFWNNGAATAPVVRYDVFDMWNSNVMSGVVSVALVASTNTSRTVFLPQNKTGWFRLTSRIMSVNDSQDEATTAIYPYALTLTANAATDWLGGHAHSSPFHIHRENLANRKWARTLSPNYQGIRWDIMEPSRGNMTFVDAVFTNWFAEGVNSLGTLTPTDGVWPTWATNGDGTADLGAFSNYCFRVVDHYKGWCTNWEIGPNEPFQSGPIGNGPAGAGTNLPINVRIATNYAKILTAGISGVTNADATAKIVAIAGAFGAGDWAFEAWTNLSAASQAAVSYISTHIYPQDQGQDPNDPENAASHFSNPYGWITIFGGIRPIWNTESGTYGVGPIKGLNGIWPVAYDLQASYSVEAARNERMHRQTDNTVRILTQALRCIGAGFEKYFYYDSRYFNDNSFTGTQPYPADYMQVDRPENVTLSVATHFIRKGFGRITNVNEPRLEMYAFTNAAGNAVVSAWNWARTNSLLTVTNSAFALHDAMGNQSQTNTGTAKIMRFPQYLVSSTMTLSQLSNTVKYASVAASADTLPPQISFDIAPSGLWTGGDAPLVKWTALDDVSTAWQSNWTSTNVLYKWKLDGGSYSTYSQSNHVWLSGLANGDHTVYVTAKDLAGNDGEAVYRFALESLHTNVVLRGKAIRSGRSTQ